MTKYNKLLSKCAVLLATLGAGAILASAHVSAHAATSNDGWEDGVVHTGSMYAPGISDADKARVQKMINTPESEANKRADAKVQAALAKLDAIDDRKQSEDLLKTQIYYKKRGIYAAVPASAIDFAKKTLGDYAKVHPSSYAARILRDYNAITKATKKHAKKVTSKKVTKSVAKKATKKVAKKNVKKATVKKATKKVAKKHVKRLFSIRVKAQKIYAYKNIKLQKQGRKAEKKGTKLYVYGIVKKGHKTFYKVYDGRLITASKSAVTKINNYVSRVIV